MRTLLTCPNGSISTMHQRNARDFMEDFPLRLNDEVYYTGFGSTESYASHGYVIHLLDGNWHIDSQKYLPHLIRRFEELGGIRYNLLTPRDDVAEAHKYAKRLGRQRIIHRAERSARPDADGIIDGHTVVDLASEFTIIPT